MFVEFEWKYLLLNFQTIMEKPQNVQRKYTRTFMNILKSVNKLKDKLIM